MTNEINVDEMKSCYENLILIDCGSNLISKKFARDLDLIMKRAKDSGMCGIVFLQKILCFRNRNSGYFNTLMTLCTVFFQACKKSSYLEIQ